MPKVEGVGIQRMLWLEAGKKVMLFSAKARAADKGLVGMAPKTVEVTEVTSRAAAFK